MNIVNSENTNVKNRGDTNFNSNRINIDYYIDVNLDIKT